MKRIKKFNESQDKIDKIWCVIVTDQVGFTVEEKCKCFYNMMMAADYFIKTVNEEEDTSFEPFYEDGNRLFTNIDENTDWEECLTFIEGDNVINIDIIETTLSNNPE